VRVVLLSTFGESCGIATYSEALAPALRGAGAEVEVLAPFLAKVDVPRGEQPPRLWNRNRAFGFEALRVVRAVRAARADVVHAQVNLSLYSSRFLFSLGTALRAVGVPLVATLHGRRGGSWGRNFKITRLLFGLRHADLVVHSAAHAAELRRPRVHVIPHGAAAQPSRSIAAARAAIGLEGSGPVIAHFGFLFPDKGVAEVVRAVAELRKGPVPDLRYWIAGAVHTTEGSRRYAADLRGLIAELGLGDAVRMTGAFASDERVALELQAADWVVLNYLTGSAQGASGAARVALASGRAVAVSEAPIFDDLREAALTLHPPLPGALASMLLDREQAREMEARARRYCDAISWSRVGERHVALYQEILARRAAAEAAPQSM
jgi:glycosyltransferase involved in cell wall biosynthesis